MIRVVKQPTIRKSEIIDAAHRLFLTQDYENTTMQDIMNACGIAKGTIYHYFKSKEELLEAVITRMVDARITEMENHLQTAQGNALEKMQQLIHMSHMASAHPEWLEHLHRPANAVIHMRMFSKTLIKLAALFEKLIQQGCHEGLFQTEHPKECAEFILSAIQFLTDVGIYPWTEADLKRRAAAFPRLLEQQLHAPPGSFQLIGMQFYSRPT
jgi:AcrR family transcriptional regulator